MNFCLAEKTHKLTKNAFKDEFWKKRITFLYEFKKGITFS
jgi:hypothetical protein